MTLEASVSEGKLSSEESTTEEKPGKGLSFRLGGRFQAPDSGGDLSFFSLNEEDVVDQVAQRFRRGAGFRGPQLRLMASLDESEDASPEVDETYLLDALDVPIISEAASARALPTKDIPMVEVEPLTVQLEADQAVAAAATVVCPTCRAENPAEMNYCVECGGALLKASGASAQKGQYLNVGAEPILEVRREPPPATKASKEKNPWPMQLVSINEDGSDGEALPLQCLETTVGREGDSGFPTDTFLSPRHARFHVEEGSLFVEDLYSVNGTFVKLNDEIRLTPGDTILMGRQVLRFERFEQPITAKTKTADGTRYMGSPAPGGAFKIIQVGIGGIIQNVYCLPETGAVLGREKGDIVFPHDKFMSGRHAQIYANADGHCYLADLNSSNGTWIKLWEKMELKKDDYIFMGQQLFRVHFG